MSDMSKTVRPCSIFVWELVLKLLWYCVALFLNSKLQVWYVQWRCMTTDACRLGELRVHFHSLLKTVTTLIVHVCKLKVHTGARSKVGLNNTVLTWRIFAHILLDIIIFPLLPSSSPKLMILRPIFLFWISAGFPLSGYPDFEAQCCAVVSSSLCWELCLCRFGSRSAGVGASPAQSALFEPSHLGFTWANFAIP